MLLATTTLVLGGCAQAGQITDDARARVDDARGQLDDLVAQADEIRDRFSWCGAAVRLSSAVATNNTVAADAAATELRDDVPPELEDELATIVEAVAAAQSGEADALLDGDVQDAATAIVGTAIADCGLDEG